MKDPRNWYWLIMSGTFWWLLPYAPLTPMAKVGAAVMWPFFWGAVAYYEFVKFP